MASRGADHDFVVVGTVVKPHGIKGEICVISHADSPSLFKRIPRLYLRSRRGEPERYKLVALRLHKGRPLLTLQGVANRNRAEELRGMEVVVRREDMPEPTDGEVYLHDILGFMVVLADGSELGPFTGFIETAATEVWTIKHPDAEILLPAVDDVILAIDMDTEKITVEPPPGLLELYLSAEAKPKKKKPGRRRRRSSKATSGKKKA